LHPEQIKNKLLRGHRRDLCRDWARPAGGSEAPSENATVIVFGKPGAQRVRPMPDGALKNGAFKNGALKKLCQRQATLTGGAKLKDRTQFAFGAQFAEVRIHAQMQKIRVPRLVGATRRGVRVRKLPIRAETLLGTSIPRT